MLPAELAHGPMLMGFIFNVFLFGLITAQAHFYVLAYSRDKLEMKLFASSWPLPHYYSI
ncbi:hypothetical protein PM082_008022 [Marasmius tenuissimus]|nr:hypothetical protein PM082_008022 [Marasmius tenuissimus]